MPRYDFRCTNCEHEMEARAKMDELTKTCPECDHPMERLISRVGPPIGTDTPIHHTRG